jgi:putative hemolysin
MRQMDWLLLAVIAVLFAVSIVTAAGETAFTKMSKVRALTLEEEGRKGAARLVRMLDTPEWTLNVLLLLMMAAHFAVASLVAIIVEHHFGGVGVLAGTVVEVLLFFVLAEVAPKTYAILQTDRAATRLSTFMWVVSRFPPLRAVTKVLIAMANVVLPGKGLKKGPYTTEEEIRTMADVAADEQVIEREERRLIHSIFEFGDTVVREVMVPRPDMVGVEGDASVDEALQMAIGAGYSRLPVYGEGPDDILGLVYLKDIIRRTRETATAATARSGSWSGRRCSSPSKSAWRSCSGRCSRRSSTWPWSSTSTGARPGSSRSRTSWKRSWGRSSTSTTSRRRRWSASPTAACGWPAARRSTR